MALTKQQVAVNFQKGLDTKTDPWQVPIGNFLSLENSIFTKQGLLQKRYGFQQIGTFSDLSVNTIDTFNGELTAIGNNLYAYNNSLNEFVDKGVFYPAGFSKLPVINNGFNHLQCDSATSPNRLVCIAYTRDTTDPYTKYWFTIIDEITGQNIVEPTTLPVIAGTVSGPPRVFVLNNNFVIIYPVTSGTTSIQFISIGCNTLTAQLPQTVAPSYSPNPGGTVGINWDAVTVNNKIIVGYNVAGSGFYCNLINPDLTVPVATQIDAAHQATCVGAGTDGTNAYFGYWSTTTGAGYVVGVSGVSGNAASTFSPTSFVGAASPLLVISNITLSVISSTIYITYEWQGSYTYFPATTATVPNNQIYIVTCSTAGVIGPAPTAATVKGAGLASKSFIIGGAMYFAVAYSVGNGSTSTPVNTYQGCYFVIQGSGLNAGAVVSQFAYQNGNGYLLNGLPSATVQQFTGTTLSGSNVVNGIIDTSNLVVGQKIISSSFPLNNTYIKSIDSISQITLTRSATVSGSAVLASSIVEFGYLNRSVTRPLAQQTETISTPASYSQAGINLANLELYKDHTQTAEIGRNLNLAAGFLWGYDGFQVTENGFFIYPDSIYISPVTNSVGSMGSGTYYYRICYEWTDNQGSLFRSSPSVPTSYEIKAASIFVGDTHTGTKVIDNIASTSNLQVGQVVANGTTIPAGAYITEITSSTAIKVSVNSTGNAVGSTITASQISKLNINVPTLRLSYKANVNIVVYRYSAAFPIYYQVSSVTSPTINDPTVDYLTITDSSSDLQIAGNTILYTTGGVIENIATPSCNALTVFDNRLWLADSENGNLLWYSKQVIENTPVEMSDLLTFYVSPTQSLQGSTGPITALFVMDDKLVIFKKDAIYYINGNGPDDTGANSQYSEPVYITGTIGSINPNSLAIIPQGVVSQGNKGIWLLGRDLSTSYIGAPVEEYTKNSLVLSAQVIPGTNQVRFVMDSGITLMYDYFYGQWGTFTGINNLHTTVYQDLHTFIDQYGRVCQENIGSYLDITNPVLMKFTTNWYALGGLQGYQRAYFFFLLGKYQSPHKLNVQVAYDFNPNDTQTTLITPDNYSAVFGSDPVYGSSFVWGGPSQVEKWRIMLQKQKCDSLQFSVSEIYDPSYGVTAGAGLTLSGMNIIIGVKKGYGPISQFNTAG